MWNKTSFGHVQKNLNRAKEQLKLAHQIDPLSQNVKVISEARREVKKWLSRGEIMWRQRSKAMWLAEGG